ncbi:MAG: 2,3,4,5-tetrahydropyridine-2,6-dicarboxylate N-succinyltransferase [Hyphomicrobiales bacterium]|nr:2,3,4,5-tetrahydropyridine-2,6-dicarboxylate N-succinyltransferase [Hyphomicrobiales bacterium]MBV8824272.1 2,3,4,5-tetrahydropyridine-2,6-dicarboxylate N-succinyltransferase [Hyphomicrobiales bacterium]MBV9428572.1 2,3,4,5-tetrahydropyridine-2,6-dicarboxylate N-succinyltransferase [Bradyrhizobiaceae bacterium]
MAKVARQTSEPAPADLAGEVDEAFEASTLAPRHREAVEAVIAGLDRGELRVAEKKADVWVTNVWVKKAILLYFKIRQAEPIASGAFSFCDKVPVKRWTGGERVRVVPQAIARRGSFVEAGAILMPSFVNIGAYVGSGTMVDTWVTVGSGAQVGRDVHLAGGMGIGGVLEPVQASPVIIEDNVFIGSRCIVVEGVQIGEGAVLGAGVVITGSTKIIDVRADEPREYRGKVPANAVVIPGTTPRTFAAGTYGVPCALIVGTRRQSTSQKTSLTEALREFNVPV